MGCRVMRAHVDREHLLFGFQFELDSGDPLGQFGREVGDRDLFVAQGAGLADRPGLPDFTVVKCVFDAPSLPPARVGHFVTGEDHRLATDREVPALRPADVVLGHQDPRRSGWPSKTMPKKSWTSRSWKSAVGKSSTTDGTTGRVSPSLGTVERPSVSSISIDEPVHRNRIPDRPRRRCSPGRRPRTGWARPPGPG